MSDPRAMTEVYQATVVQVWDPAVPDVALDPASVAQQRGEQAVVLTAWNPGDARWSREDNERANEQLGRVLASTGFAVWAADGRDQEGKFHEPGFCVWGMTDTQGLDIARQFGQFAIYVYRPSGARDIGWTADGVMTPGSYSRPV
jgi:hypothetical protein